MAQEISLEKKYTALQLFIEGKSHTEALAAIGHQPDPSNRLLWGWGAEFERMGLYKDGQLLSLPPNLRDDWDPAEH